MDIISNKNINTMQFYYVLLTMPGLKYLDSNIIIILQHENRPEVWSGPHITHSNYYTQQYSEKILASL